MFELRGQRVSEGIAIGPAVIFTSAEIRVKASYVRPDRVDNEIRRFRRAVNRTEQDIAALLDRDHVEESADVRNIILTTRDFLRDDALLEEIEQLVSGENFAAPYAVSTVIGGLAEKLQAIDNPTFSSKVADMIDIEHRLLNHLLGGRADPRRDPQGVSGEGLGRPAPVGRTQSYGARGCDHFCRPRPGSRPRGCRSWRGPRRSPAASPRLPGSPGCCWA